MSRVCRACKDRKEPDQFPRGSNGARLATCLACREVDAHVTSETRDYMRWIKSDWITIANVAELQGVTQVAARNAIRNLVKHKLAEGRAIRYPGALKNEFKLTAEGVERLAKLETMTLKKSSEPRAKPPFGSYYKANDKRPYFPWLDLGADIRPNYNDNARYVPDTSKQKGFVI